jgi:FixJ family two-component response regulator
VNSQGDRATSFIREPKEPPITARRGSSGPGILMNSLSKLAVCLVDDDPDLRNLFKLLMKSSNIPVVTYPSAEEFLATFEQKNLGCLVLDVRMPGIGGLELLETLRQRNIFIPVILLTGFADVPLAVRALHSGALEVLEKPFREEELLSHIRKAITRYERLKRFEAERQAVAPRFASLTPRELEVLDLMVAGKKNRQIAEQLGISTKTLDIHRANILRKMQTKTVADLVRWRLMEKTDPFAVNPHE